MAAVRSRQLLLSTYSSFLGDKASSLSTSTALPALANQIAEASGKLKDIFGPDATTKQEVESWLSKIDADQVGDFKSVEGQLQSKTYLTGSTPTAADVALLGSLYSTVSQWAPAEQHSHPSVSRYISHLSQVFASNDVKAWEPTYEGMPAIQRKDLAQDKKEKSKAKAEAAAGAATDAQKQGKGAVAAVAGSAAAAGEQQQKSKKEKKGPEDPAAAAAKKEKKAKSGGGGGGSGGGGAAAEPVANSPAMIDLRVGKIVEISKHPDADSLYLEKVDFGEAEPRTVISGLVKFVPIEEMQNRWVVGVCNLKPAAMRGIKSYAMLLCASTKDHSTVEPVLPPEGSSVGDKVEVEGYEGQTPLEQLNPKKKIFEWYQPSLTTTEAREAAWTGPAPDGSDSRNRLMRTAKGVVKAPTLVGASLS